MRTIKDIVKEIIQSVDYNMEQRDVIFPDDLKELAIERYKKLQEKRNVLFDTSRRLKCNCLKRDILAYTNRMDEIRYLFNLTEEDFK